MRFTGKVYKDGKFWLAEIQILDAITQGHTKKEAFAMAVDLVETLALKPKFKAQIHKGKNEKFEIGSDDTQTLISLLLRRQREKSGLSLAQVAQRLGAKSRNAYARYEQGSSVPTIEKLNQLLKALSPKHDFVLCQSFL